MTVALIDGDAITHGVVWIAWKNTNPISYINRLEGGGSNFADDPPHVRDAIFERCKASYEKAYKKILTDVSASSYRLAIRGLGNYRERLDPNYKKSRKSGKSSPVKEYVNMIDQWLTETGVATPANGREADDLVRIWATELDAADVDHISCHIDKDLDQIPGRHYDMKVHWEYYVEKFDGLKLFYRQLLSGDPVDSIPGLAGVGDKTAAKWILPCKTEEEMQEVVIEKYFEKVPETWYETLLLMGRLLYIQETAESDFKTLLDAWPIMSEMR